MSLTQHFVRYAAAFEKAVRDDDWSVVEPFFTEDAVYEVPLGPPLGARLEGRDAILAYFKEVLDRFDRRFDSREVELLEGPREQGDSVWIRGRAVYRKRGVPELAFELEETATFEGDRICRLADHYDGSAEDDLSGYLAQHGEALGIDL
jgi:hypothetical protein